MDQNDLPVFNGLLHYKKTQRVSFHVPGHKDGTIFPENAQSIYHALLSIDATEVAALDDLYRPTGILREGEALLSDYYQTEASYFLVSGSTGGNLAMLFACLNAGDQVFVQRDSHKSIFNGMKLIGANPIFLAPMIDEDSGLAFGLGPDTLLAAIRRYPEARALVLTYPNYYGMAAPIEPLIRLAHAHGLIVLVDEAHGPHFGLGAPVPQSSLAAGADLVVQSAHKMLPAMTMGAYLHLNSKRVLPERLENARAMLQTSSPSYPIMASLDLARYYLAHLSPDALAAIYEERDAFVDGLNRLDGIHVLQPSSGRYQLDPFKLTVGLETAENGFAWQERLIESGIFPEMADPDHVLFTLGIARRKDDPAILQQIAASLSGFHRKSVQRERAAVYAFPPSGQLAASYTALSQLKTEEANLENTVGRIAAEPVIPYPPGVPLIIQGEKVTAGAIRCVLELLQAGTHFQNQTIVQRKLLIYQSGA
ncbi:MAG: aminotransferase class I/II-fold pyridoxal phosphate-dependent enzyme [Sporolactobacillus sp.]